ncbi:BET1-like protein [Liolophura sinensis]|uniref:BET1-like protein n=1 Tax=Liolophura sinensis TaxID=3198878 RepID=UPI003158D41E
MANFRNGRDGRSEEMLDNENQHRVDGLSGKVSRLKEIAFDIELEAKDQNRYIDDVHGEFDSSHGLLSGSVGRLSNMLGTGRNNRRLMCYIIVGFVGLFFVAYFVASRVTA